VASIQIRRLEELLTVEGKRGGRRQRTCRPPNRRGDLVIKARGRTNDGRDLVLLGLSHENVARLFADEPIVVPTSAPGPRGIGLDGGPVVVIVAGSDEDAIVESLRAAGLEAEQLYDERGEGDVPTGS
jgi:hypothetical protein